MANILIPALLSVVFVISRPVEAYARNVSSLEIESESLLGRKSVSDKGEDLMIRSNATIITQQCRNCFQSSSKF